jgi:hypothetical protein
LLVIKEVGKYTYQLDLPAIMDIHPIFHHSLFEPVRNNPHAGQTILAAEPLVIEGEPEYEVEKVLDSYIS